MRERGRERERGEGKKGIKKKGRESRFKIKMLFMDIHVHASFDVSHNKILQTICKQNPNHTHNA